MKPSRKFGLLMLALFAAPSAYAQLLDTAPDTSDQVEIAQKLIDRHFAIWNSDDFSSRKPSFGDVYAQDFFVADYRGVSKGYDAVIAMIGKLHAEHPGFKFTPKPVALNHGLGRVTWGYGPADNPDLITGEDVFTVEGGKLSSARVFLNKK